MAYSETKAAANAEATGLGRRQTTDMGRIIRLILILAILGTLGLLGYAYSGYLQPETRSVTEPVDLNVD